MIMKKYPDNFLKRVEYFKLFKKRNLENLRNQNFMDISSELRFEPKIKIKNLMKVYKRVIMRLLN